MELLYILLALVMAVSGLMLYRRQQQDARDRWEASENRPELLQKARLELSEKPLRCESPICLHGKVDQAYRLENGRLCIVDTKSRKHPRVYAYDIIQGSVYAFILWAQGNEVHPVAYVRVVLPSGRVEYLPYELMAPAQLKALYDRRRMLLDHPNEARLAAHPALCKGCGQREAGRCGGHQ